jgi:hypothetical protein
MRDALFVEGEVCAAGFPEPFDQILIGFPCGDANLGCVREGRRVEVFFCAEDCSGRVGWRACGDGHGRCGV